MPTSSREDFVNGLLTGAAEARNYLESSKEDSAEYAAMARAALA